MDPMKAFDAFNIFIMYDSSRNDLAMLYVNRRGHY